MDPYVLGVDIGTGSVKAVAVDFSGHALHSTQSFYQTLQPQPGFQEQDPLVVFHAFTSSIRDLIFKTGSEPRAVSLSSAMHSVMAVDEEGRPLTNLVLWSDARSAAIAEELRFSEEGKAIYRSCGTPIHSMTPLCKIIWFRQNSPEVFERTFKFISIKEFIWHRLFGEFNIDQSLASATGLFDIIEKTWSPRALTLAGIDSGYLSTAVPTSYRRAALTPEASEALQLSLDVHFCIGASDGCLANLGTLALGPDTAAITIGTSGAVRVVRSKPLINETAMPFNYILDAQSFICGGPVNNGGNILDWLQNCFYPNAQKNYQEIFEQMEKLPVGSEGLVFLPYLQGERAPVWDEGALGVYFGIRQHHQQGHFLSAALEGVCFNLRQILEMLESEGEPVNSICVSGGFVHSPVWTQMLADITQKDLVLKQTEDASALGAAYLVLKSLMIISDYKVLLQQPGSIIHPRKEYREVYEKNFSVFQSLYPSLQELMHRKCPL